MDPFVYLFDSLLSTSLFLFYFISAFKYLPEKRLFLYLCSQICLSTSLSYFYMYQISSSDNYDKQLITISRYINWIITTPSLLTIMGYIGKINLYNIYTLCMLDIFMILCGLFGEFAPNHLKYVYFSFGMICFYPIQKFLFSDFDYQVVHDFFGKYTADRYYKIGRYFLFVWFYYPIVWIIDQTTDFKYTSILYSILDFFSKIILTLWIYICLIKSNYLVEIYDDHFDIDI
jgi:bacteriorhodopsin